MVTMLSSWVLETAQKYLADVALYTFFFALGSLFTSWNMRTYYQLNNHIAQALGMFGAGAGGRLGAGAAEGPATVISVRSGGGVAGLDLRVGDLERIVLAARSSALRDAACLGGMCPLGAPAAQLFTPCSREQLILTYSPLASLPRLSAVGRACSARPPFFRGARAPCSSENRRRSGV